MALASLLTAIIAATALLRLCSRADDAAHYSAPDTAAAYADSVAAEALPADSPAPAVAGDTVLGKAPRFAVRPFPKGQHAEKLNGRLKRKARTVAMRPSPHEDVNSD